VFCEFLVFAKSSMIPSGTGHASPGRLSCPLLPPSVAGAPAVRWRATPPGTARAVQWPARSGAPVRPAPSRHSRRPLRSRRLSRARPAQTGGDPAAPGWHRARLNPAQPGRSCARPARRRGTGGQCSFSFSHGLHMLFASAGARTWRGVSGWNLRGLFIM
jgi:hypothetical protein